MNKLIKKIKGKIIVYYIFQNCWVNFNSSRFWSCGFMSDNFTIYLGKYVKYIYIIKYLCNSYYFHVIVSY